MKAILCLYVDLNEWSTSSESGVTLYDAEYPNNLYVGGQSSDVLILNTMLSSHPIIFPVEIS